MVLGVIGRIAHSHPIKFGCVFSCAKTSFSDWLVQTQVEKRERIDWKRNLTFASFGFFYLGGVQYFLYVPVFSRLFPGAAAFAKAPLAAKLKDTVGQRNMVVQVVIDNSCITPSSFQSFTASRKWSTVAPSVAASPSTKRTTRRICRRLEALVAVMMSLFDHVMHLQDSVGGVNVVDLDLHHIVHAWPTTQDGFRPGDDARKPGRRPPEAVRPGRGSQAGLSLR